ncbi:MAG: DUF4998 domain-containing protein [Prevotellaceae bacterium]|jgi:hypothetical protein|nr:DUF4998 domain-containing protein [Prevotellaceae bacterium]
MKVIIKYFLPAYLLICIAGCDDNNLMHQKYLDEGETLYIGKTLYLVDSAGNERVKFSWILNSDPRIDKSVFSWTDGETDHSVEIAIRRTQSGYLIMDTILSVKEGIYTFSLKNRDDKGHESMPLERTVQVYGPTYISKLSNRNLSSSFADGKLTVNWVIIENALIQYSTVQYTDYSNPANPVRKSIRIENTDTQTEIEGVREGDTFSIFSSYLPEGGLDILDASPVEYTIR